MYFIFEYQKKLWESHLFEINVQILQSLVTVGRE